MTGSRALSLATIALAGSFGTMLGCGARSVHEPLRLGTGGMGGETSSSGGGLAPSRAGTHAGGRGSSAGEGFAGSSNSGAPNGGASSAGRPGGETGGRGDAGRDGTGGTPPGSSGEAGVSASNSGGEAGTPAGGCVPPPVPHTTEVSTCCAGKPCRGRCTSDGVCDCGGPGWGCSEGFACCRVLGPVCVPESDHCGN